MKQISANASPLPRLAISGSTLEASVLGRIDEVPTARPAAYVTGVFWSFIELLYDTLRAFDFDSLEGQEAATRKRALLSNVELLMHRCSSMNDYLGKLMYAALPAEGKKNKSAYSVKKRLDYRIERLCKVPINLVKHEGFQLCWLEMRQGLIATHGYCVTGPVGGQQCASVKYRPSDAGSPEGYSFALILRDLLLAMFDMTDIAEAALADAGLFDAEVNPGKLTDARQAHLEQMLTLLNGLPLKGFPDEHGVRVPIYWLKLGAMYVTTKPLQMLAGTFRIQTELATVTPGMGYRLPYFRGGSG